VGKIWLSITAIAGLVAAPFIAEGMHQLIDEGPAWFPFLVVMVLGAVALLAGDLTRGVAWGMMTGIVAFAILLSWWPDTVEFLNTEIHPPF